ncbi:MAG: hypothetical protein EXR75_06160 [Myxococcales bacterium]|nr:hypothetical protein [Myxococcales bacterium]
MRATRGPPPGRGGGRASGGRASGGRASGGRASGGRASGGRARAHTRGAVVKTSIARVDQDGGAPTLAEQSCH